MEMNKQERECVYLTYFFPMRFIVHEGERIDFSIDEINNLSYNHFLLCRIVGEIKNTFMGQEVSYIICGDGAIGIKNEAVENMELHLNDLLCKLRLGGFVVDAVNRKDITTGHIHNNNSIWPVNYGESLNTHLHASIRMKTTGNTDAIYLLNASEQSLTINDVEQIRAKGTKIVDSISNLSTFHLINGITEYRYCNWSSALTYLWIVVEEIIDWLWQKRVIATMEHTEVYKSRKLMLEDTRSYTTSVKQEFLFQNKVLSAQLYTNLFQIRHARNKLIHEGRVIDSEIASKLYVSVQELLSVAIGETVSF